MAARFRINQPHVLHETIDGEVVIINLDTGNYYSLRNSGASVWSAIEGGAGMQEIAAAFRRKYRADTDALQDLLAKFIGQLQSEGLIEPCDDSEASAKLYPAGDESAPTQPEPFDPPVLEKFDDMQDLILLDPVHEVDDEKGWPHPKRSGKREIKS
jgi:hypothetical protein